MREVDIPVALVDGGVVVVELQVEQETVRSLPASLSADESYCGPGICSAGAWLDPDADWASQARLSPSASVAFSRENQIC